MSLRPPSPNQSFDSDSTAALREERRRQVRGSLLLALGVLLFAVLRAGLHRVFGVGWWRLW